MYVYVLIVFNLMSYYTVLYSKLNSIHTQNIPTATQNSKKIDILYQHEIFKTIFLSFCKMTVNTCIKCMFTLACVNICFM